MFKLSCSYDSERFLLLKILTERVKLLHFVSIFSSQACLIPMSEPEPHRVTAPAPTKAAPCGSGSATLVMIEMALAPNSMFKKLLYRKLIQKHVTSCISFLLHTFTFKIISIIKKSEGKSP
jgi:hypothetical protein